VVVIFTCSRGGSPLYSPFGTASGKKLGVAIPIGPIGYGKWKKAWSGHSDRPYQIRQVGKKKLGVAIPIGPIGYGKWKKKKAWSVAIP